MNYTRANCPICGEPTYSDINGGDCAACRVKALTASIVATLNRIADGFERETAALNESRRRSGCCSATGLDLDRCPEIVGFGHVCS